MLTITPRKLCQNALLAAAAPQTVPAGTKSFLKTYTKASTAANFALTNLLTAADLRDPGREERRHAHREPCKSGLAHHEVISAEHQRELELRARVLITGSGWPGPVRLIQSAR